jgi:CubicO group peptidase (beta-lactamase class C family)
LLTTQNKINLDDDIRLYLPDMPIYETPISILHLVHHTSGLRDMNDLQGMVATGFSDYSDTDTFYNLIMAQKALNYTPGERYSYSNSGYMLMAKIVEKVSGLSFREYMHKHVFSPIGMHHTSVFDNPFEVIENRATAYFSNDNKTFSRDNGMGAVYGSKGVYTSINDLDLWARNFVNPKVGNKEVFTLMKTTGMLNNGESTNYAFGQELKMMHGQQAIFHGGGTGAYRSYLMRFPELALSISIVANNSYATFKILKYLDDIAKVLLPQQKQTSPVSTDIAKITSIAPAILAQYTGDYQLQPGLVFSVELAESGLQLKITSQPNPIILKAYSESKFMLTDSDNGYYMLFDNSTGKSDFIRYYQGDFEYIGKRVNLVEFNKQAIDLNKYEGVYYSAELNTVYKIESKNNQLNALHARNSPILLEPFEPELFASSTPFFQEVEFIKDEHNGVQGMLVSGSKSQDVEFEKVRELP